MLPVDEILAALDVSSSRPGVGLLEALFTRFNARVPFENASKIVRNAQVGNVREKPRQPEIFWEEHLELGTGGVCFDRVAAFDALLQALEFSTRRILGRVERDFDHAAVQVSLDGRVFICDVGFPMPALLPAQDGLVDTASGELAIRRTARGFRIDFLSGVPEGSRSVELFDAEVSQERFDERWRETFLPDSKFLSGLVLRRQEPSRVVSFARGKIRIDDRHSRLELALGGSLGQRLSDLFQIDRGLLERTLDIAPLEDNATPENRLTVYLETPATAQAAFTAIGSCEKYRALMEGVAVVTSLQVTPSGWRLTLAAPERTGSPDSGFAKEGLMEEGLVEEVAVFPERLAMRVRRQSERSPSECEIRVERHANQTFLVREAIFDSPREDLLRNDSLRGRLAGSLAVDLLAWSRAIGA